MAAKFDPSRSRAARPGQNVQDTSGQDFATAQAQQRGTQQGVSRFRPEYHGVTPERSFSSRQLASMDNDRLLDRYADGTRVNPYEIVNVPTPRVMSQYIEFVDEYTSGALGKTGAYDPKTSNVGSNVGLRQGGDRQPAPQSLVPTSTINPNRPRTLTAGFEIVVGEETGKLTVQFRDGTYYNYYEVPPKVWEDFKTAISKGRYIEAILNGFPRGFASGGNAVGRKTLHKAARVSQRMLHARSGKRMMSQGKPVQVSRQTRKR